MRGRRLKLPALAQFQYLRASERRFRDAALAALTPEEVRAHYDKLVKDKNSFPGFDLRFDEKEWRDSLTSPKKDGDKKDAKDKDGKDPKDAPKDKDAKDKDAAAKKAGATPKAGAPTPKGGAATPKAGAPTPKPAATPKPKTA